MKTRLVMKRLRDLKPGDVMIGRQSWTDMSGEPRHITDVHPSNFRPGKITFTYRLGKCCRDGFQRRWPDFYVICLKSAGPHG